jgi:hypothetical protein
MLSFSLHATLFVGHPLLVVATIAAVGAQTAAQNPVIEKKTEKLF